MNKYLLILCFLTFSINSTYADFGTFYADAARIGLVINNDNAETFYKFTTPSNGKPDNLFNGLNINSSITSIKIRSLYVNTANTIGDNIEAVSFWFRIYPVNSLLPPTFTKINLSVVNTIGSANSKTLISWSKVTGNNVSDVQLINDVYANTVYVMESYVLLENANNKVVLTLPGYGNFNNETGTGNINYLNPPLPITNSNGIFKVNFRTAGVLSLNNLQDFIGKYNNNKVILTWGLLSNTGLKTIELQKSENGVNWNTLKSYNVENIVSPNYQFIDASLNDGLNLYRLIGLGQIGDESFSKIIRINVSIIDNSLQVFPIPAKDRITVLMNGIKKGQYQAFLFNVDGAKIFLKEFEHDGFNNAKTFDIPTILATGNYMLMIKNKQEFYKQGLIIQQ